MDNSIPPPDSPTQPVPHALPSTSSRRSSGAAWRAGAAVVVLGLGALWSYWPTLVQLVERWSVDPQYSHGFLVPVFAAVILWLRRPAETTWQPNAWGLLILAISLVPRWFTARMDLTHLDGLCLIGSLLGVVLLVGGTGILRWTWPAILFLGFMVPLPHSIEEGIAIPLRTLATQVSTYVLQTFGYPALAEGNIIHIDEVRLGVIDACSGLGMLMTFLALGTAMAMVLPGPAVDRVVLVLSGIPIAVFANVLRITITGMLFYSFGGEEHHRKAIHDALGLWLMMPLALVLLWLEWKFLRALLISTGEEKPLTVQLTPWVKPSEPATSKP